MTPRGERELDDEIRAHLDLAIQAQVDRGLAPEEARRAALQQFGSRVRVKEVAREASGWFGLEVFARDALFGCRSLLRHPGYTLAAILSLALGIGANTLIFSLLDATLLKPLPLPGVDRLVVLWNVADPTRPTQLGTSSIARYGAFRDQAQSFESVGAFNGLACGQRSFGLDQNGAPAEKIVGQTFSASLFRTLGVQPLMGRVFTDTEDQADSIAPVTLISYAMWQRRFGGDPQVLGHTMLLNRVRTTVIGVLPKTFDVFGDPVEFFAPLCLTRAQVESRGGGNTVVARLKPGVSIAQAQAELETIATRLAIADPERHQGLGVRVEAFQRARARLFDRNGQPTGDYGSPLLMLQGAVAFVLLVACANVAGLLLARASGRRGELALRLALGASRWRLVRQLLAENVPVAVGGGALGVVLAWGGLALFETLAPADFPGAGHVTLDLRVLVFAAAIVVLTIVLFAVLPAIQSSNVTLAERIGAVGRDGSAPHARPHLRVALVTGQMALAMVLLVGAGLLINSFARVIGRNLGADPHNLLMFEFRLPLADGATQAGRYRGNSLWDVSPVPAQTFDRVLDRVQRVPGVTSSGASNMTPFGSLAITMPFIIDGRPRPSLSGAPGARRESSQTANYLAITPNYLQTMRIPIRQGRDFDAHDTADHPSVAIINQTFAQQFFPNQNAVGQRLTLDFVPNEPSREIVAVVGDTVVGPLQRRQEPAIYVPHLQQTSHAVGAWVYARVAMVYTVRTSGDPLRLVPELKRAVAEVDPLTPLSEVHTVSQTMNAQIGDLRLSMLLLGLFGAIATLLAATGLYGVLAYSVAARTREIGIRMALGAPARAVLLLIGRQAGWMVTAGLLLGLGAALTLTRVIQAQLFGVTSTDPVTYAAVAVTLLLIAVLAAVVPTRRATRVDPIVALRTQ